MLNTHYVDYMFEDQETGEEFFVEIDTTNFWTEADAKAEAISIARAAFESPKLVTIMTEQEAEWYGLDTY